MEKARMFETCKKIQPSGTYEHYWTNNIQHCYQLKRIATVAILALAPWVGQKQT
jgi:hypothetical protein